MYSCWVAFAVAATVLTGSGDMYVLLGDSFPYCAAIAQYCGVLVFVCRGDSVNWPILNPFTYLPCRRRLMSALLASAGCQRVRPEKPVWLCDIF